MLDKSGKATIHKPAPVLITYGSARESTLSEPTAPAAITTKFVNLPAVLTHVETHAFIVFSMDNGNRTLSDLTHHSDDESITLPDRQEIPDRFPSFGNNDLPSNDQELTSIREEDVPPSSFTMYDLDYYEIQEMRDECKSKDTAYCFSVANQTTRYYHGREMIEGCQTAADWFTTYLDDNTKKWHPIPEGFSAPHWPEDYVDAINILREEDAQHVNSILIEAAKELDRTRNSGEDRFEILSLSDVSWDDKNRMRSLLCSEAVTYRFTQPWNDGHHHYQGSLPQRGEQDAADRLIEVFLEDTEEYAAIPEGYTAPREPYDHIDALNWEKIANERARHRQILASHGVPESNLSGSDWEVTRQALMQDRARRKERGKEVSDTEEEDNEMEEEEMEEGRQRSPNSRSVSVARSSRTVSSASSTPPVTSAAEMLAELGMTLPVEDAILEAVSTKKVTIFEQSCYSLFGEYVCRMAAELGTQFGRRSDFVMERAELLLKEKRGPNRANKFRTYISRTRQDEMQGSTLQHFFHLTNVVLIAFWAVTKEEKAKFMDQCYVEYMEGTTTSDEREERMQDVYEYLQDDVVEGGSSIVAPEVRFERWRAMIERLVSDFFFHSLCEKGFQIVAF